MAILWLPRVGLPFPGPLGAQLGGLVLDQTSLRAFLCVQEGPVCSHEPSL